LTISGGIEPSMQPRVEALQRATAEGLSAILTLRERVARLEASGREIARIAPNVPRAAATLGMTAASCATAAAGAIANAMASVTVSVEVTVRVSATASASAG
jgi:hypothetical protein